MLGAFTSWNGVPVVATNPVDSLAPVNITSVKMANDATNLYVLLTFSSPITVDDGTANNNIYMAINSTNNSPTSGFNIFGLDKIYSNTGYETNFPFTQTSSGGGNGTFNSGGTVTGAMNAVPYAPTTATAQQEISLPLNSTQTDTSAGGFTGNIFPSTAPFTVAFYNSPNTGDASFIGPISYQLASVPEPATLGLFAIGGIGLLLLGRERATCRRI
ncbi:MAG: PEP-CTERM sorting domain-containing protein [Phycisphaerae bacterium]